MDVGAASQHSGCFSGLTKTGSGGGRSSSPGIPRGELGDGKELRGD